MCLARLRSRRLTFRSTGRASTWLLVCQRQRGAPVTSTNVRLPKHAMRLWTLHPRYLDSKGLVALWREALLAQAVIRGRTRGYRHHPQLCRFQESSSPRSAINAYLAGVYAEAFVRGYNFDRSKLVRVGARPRLMATYDQLLFEWEWLLRKLRIRDVATYRSHRQIVAPDAHPLFDIEPGPISEWERVSGRTAA